MGFERSLTQFTLCSKICCSRHTTCSSRNGHSGCGREVTISRRLAETMVFSFNFYIASLENMAKVNSVMFCRTACLGTSGAVHTVSPEAIALRIDKYGKNHFTPWTAVLASGLEACCILFLWMRSFAVVQHQSPCHRPCFWPRCAVCSGCIDSHFARHTRTKRLRTHDTRPCHYLCAVAEHRQVGGRGSTRRRFRAQRPCAIGTC